MLPVYPLRVTVKVKGVVPEFPSSLLASSAAMLSAESSLRIVPLAIAEVIVAPPLAPDSVTVKPSSGSTSVSPVTLTLMVLLVSPAAKLSVPLGSAPPKSAALAGLTPLPVTAQLTLVAPVVGPLRVTVNVYGVSPEFPSNLTASAAAIANDGAMVPLPITMLLPVTSILSSCTAVTGLKKATMRLGWSARSRVRFKVPAAMARIGTLNNCSSLPTCAGGTYWSVLIPPTSSIKPGAAAVPEVDPAKLNSAPCTMSPVALARLAG